MSSIKENSDVVDLNSTVKLPLSNLKHQLIRNRICDRLCTISDCEACPFGREGDCMRSYVIYVVKCRECGDEYVGETVRPLCVKGSTHGKFRCEHSQTLARLEWHVNCAPISKMDGLRVPFHLLLVCDPFAFRLPLVFTISN
ncbi:hypothetical protein Y032_0431g1340 [Ancylostoma ceylanicum]|nr:hypothetical protein Y032_0431g1340 [Ancylostoma ceylanicum]